MTEVYWRRVTAENTPPAHIPLVFLDNEGKIWQGDMCYGMHSPWYCVHSPDGTDTFVLADSGRKVTHWMYLDEARKLLGSPP